MKWQPIERRVMRTIRHYVRRFLRLRKVRQCPWSKEARAAMRENRRLSAALDRSIKRFIGTGAKAHNVQIEGQPASGLSRSNAGLGVMVIDGRRFVESSIPANWRDLTNNACSGCALDYPRQCSIAVDHAAKLAFGGDCDDRDVVYVEAPNIEGEPGATKDD